MKTYSNYTLSNALVKHMQARKGSKFMRDYYKENGEFPDNSQVESASELTQQELEHYRTLSYSRYVSDTIAELDFDKPAVSENTPEQAANEQTINETLLAGTKNVVIEDGTINNVTIPEEVTVLANITGELENGACIKSNSSKAYTINNTSEEPVDVTVGGNNYIYMVGQYNDVYLEGKSISAASSKYADINGNVTVDPSINENVSITAHFVGETGVNYAGDKKVTISGANGDGNTDMNILAPNATVEIGGVYDTVTARVSDSTLILKTGFHANELKMKEGNVMYYGTDIKDFVKKPLDQGTIAEPYTVYVTADNFTKMTSTAGVYVISEDITKTSALTFGMFGSGKFKYDLNGHTLTCGTSRNGGLYVRGTAQIDFVGPGKFVTNTDSYGVWAAAPGVVVNVYGGDFEAYTHVLYAYEGTINVYGGTFKLLGDSQLDPKGHEKFLLNCYDANYLNGTAKMNVYGGKFYNFNPAETYGEPGGPVSYVAPGYHVVESQEDGVSVFEVVKD